MVFVNFFLFYLYCWNQRSRMCDTWPISFICSPKLPHKVNAMRESDDNWGINSFLAFLKGLSQVKKNPHFFGENSHQWFHHYPPVCSLFHCFPAVGSLLACLISRVPSCLHVCLVITTDSLRTLSSPQSKWITQYNKQFNMVMII